MEKMIPKCPECGSRDFQVRGEFQMVVTLTNPEGRWDDQECDYGDFTEVPNAYCSECFNTLPEDMATIVRFIAYNHLRGGEARSSDDTPLIVPWSNVRVFREAGKPGLRIFHKQEEE